MRLPYVYRVTRGDQADRDDNGRARGADDVRGDQDPVEATFLATVAAFAAEIGVDQLAIREPSLAMADFGEPMIEGYGLAGLFPPDLAGFHDGAQVSMSVALELVRAMLRGDGAWCRLEVDQRFFVHVAFDHRVYVGSVVDCERGVAFATARGLSVAQVADSPLAAKFDDMSGGRRAADPQWWAHLTSLVHERGAVLLEEGYVHGASRWHRLTPESIDPIRGGLAPRSRLMVWPDLSSDVDALLALEPDTFLVYHEVVWEDSHGQVLSRLLDNSNYSMLPELLADARAATVVSLMVDERHPLLAGVMPDPDGVLRARWAAE